MLLIKSFAIESNEESSTLRCSTKRLWKNQSCSHRFKHDYIWTSAPLPTLKLPYRILQTENFSVQMNRIQLKLKQLQVSFVMFRFHLISKFLFPSKQKRKNFSLHLPNFYSKFVFPHFPTICFKTFTMCVLNFLQFSVHFNFSWFLSSFLRLYFCFN